MDSYEITRVIFLKSLALIYCFAFANVINQYLGLLGERGLLPMRLFIERVSWKRAPSLFFLNCSDRFLKIAGWLGGLLSFSALWGISEEWGYLGHWIVWGGMWVLYLSFVNVGQVFYGFGWESLLLETGFIAIFFPPDHVETPLILIWIVRWLLFRVMFGAGLIKIRGDSCWKDLTCLYYHYETQPMPNPLSWYFHHFPKYFQRWSVLFTHFVEIIVPWGVLLPGFAGYLTGFLTVIFQFTLILSGNLSWLNYITIVLCIPCFDDYFWKAIFSTSSLSVDVGNWFYLVLVYAFAAFVVYRSLEPIRNLFSNRQMMNASFDPLHLVNTYGAFGSVTKRRFELVVEGTHGEPFDFDAIWKEYTFKGKPGAVDVIPPVIAPYHMRLDWLMWFAAMGSYHHHPWTLHLVKKLLENEKAVLSLIKYNPFEEKPPKYIRVELYLYEFTEKGAKHWWKRKKIGNFLPAFSLEDERLIHYCESYGWRH